MKKLLVTLILALLISISMSGCASVITNTKFGKYQGLFKYCISEEYHCIRIEGSQAKSWIDMTMNAIHLGEESNVIMYELITLGNDVYMKNCETGDLTWKLEVKGKQLTLYHKSSNYTSVDAVYEKE